VGNGLDVTVKYIDNKTGNVVSAQWNELDKATQDQIKGASKIVSVVVPAGSVRAIGRLKNPTARIKVVGKSKNTIHARKLNNLIANGKNNSADWANSQFSKDYKPPYALGTQVTDFVSDGKIEFVRVVSGKKPRGQWIMRQSDIKGLTPQQIADKFALAITDNILPPPLI
jgi:filamentous hemagglutinin